MSTAAEFKTARRQHTSLLAEIEKRTLIWIASRLPGWVNSDHLTGLGFVSIVAAGGVYWYSRSHAWALLVVILFLALNWFGDSLDGTLARVRNRLRPRYGFYVDHILDAIGAACLFTGLALSGLMTPLIAQVFLVVYLLLSIEVYLATYTLGTFHLSHWKFGPTELRILLSIGNLFALWHPEIHLGPYKFLLFDAGFAIGAAGIAAILIQATIRHTRELYREETRSSVEPER